MRVDMMQTREAALDLMHRLKPIMCRLKPKTGPSNVFHHHVSEYF